MQRLFPVGAAVVGSGLAFVLALSSPLFAQTPPAAPAAGQPVRARWVPPIKGEAELGFIRPKTQRVGKKVVTVWKVKNLSTYGSIAGLRIDETWWNKMSQPVTGGTVRLLKPLLPGEVVELKMETDYHPQMFRPNYQFTHMNGKCRTKEMQKFE